MLQVYVLHNIQTDYSDYSIYSMSIYVRILHTNRACKTTVVVEFNLQYVQFQHPKQRKPGNQAKVIEVALSLLGIWMMPTGATIERETDDLPYSIHDAVPSPKGLPSETEQQRPTQTLDEVYSFHPFAERDPCLIVDTVTACSCLKLVRRPELDRWIHQDHGAKCLVR